MKIGVIGASGFIGSEFSQLAIDKGHSIVGYSRREKESGEVEWRVFNDQPDFSGLDAIVNFAGESVAQRWSAELKKTFYESRVGVTKAITQQLRQLPDEERPKVILNASGVGVYGDRGDEKLDETSQIEQGFLADLCVDWEGAALEMKDLGIRVVIGRIGFILGTRGEAWQKMQKAFSLGAGGVLWNGRQWMPWMHVKDVAGGVLHALENAEVSGVMNLVSPDPRTNKEFTKILGKAMSRPTIFPVPLFALKLVFGEFATHVVESLRVYPKVLQETGYQFYFPDLDSCLNDLIQKGK